MVYTNFVEKFTAILKFQRYVLAHLWTLPLTPGFGGSM
uniref:Uncharacterized protein n=1 Tax=Anguilla anguilla TaxID=7936 RepID=A0A0E9PE09_ANGAN